MLTIQELALTDPPRWRRVSTGPPMLTVVYRFLMGNSCDRAFHTLLPPIVQELLGTYGADGVSLAGAPAAVELLPDWCAAAAGARPTEGVSVLKAVSLATHVALECRRSGVTEVPTPLVAARPTWEALSRSQPDGDTAVATIARMLLAVTAAGTRGDHSFAWRLLQPQWWPASFPPTCITALDLVALCWGCGNKYAAGSPGRALPRCAACKVAAYCGPRCAKPGWASDHKRACAGWASVGRLQATRLVDGSAASVTSATPTSTPAKHMQSEHAVFGIGQHDLSGNWATDWKWPAAHVEQVEAAGLHLSTFCVSSIAPLGRWCVCR